MEFHHQPWQIFFTLDGSCPFGLMDDGSGLCVASDIIVVKNPAVCPGGNGGPITRGNPINIATGNKYQLESDFISSGDFPLLFSRHYNSLKLFGGVINRQWRHNYERFLSVNLNADSPHVLANRPDGVVHLFSPLNTIGTFASEVDVVETLEQTSTGFRFISANNVIEDYDTSGRLLSMTNTRNQTIGFGHNTTTGLLDTVTDHFGRTLSLSYNNRGQLIGRFNPEVHNRLSCYCSHMFRH